MKKFTALAISLIMILALSPMSVFAVSPSDAVINIDFSQGIPDGMDVVGAELINDADKGQVMSFAGGDTGSSKATLPMSSLATTDFKGGISWTVWVKADSGIHGMSPIFTIDLNRIGYVSLLSDLVVTANSDGNEDLGIERVWSDPPGPVEEEQSALENEWTHLSVVMNDIGVYLYVNGKLRATDPFSNGNLGLMTDVLMEQMTYATGITLGSYNCDWWKFGDFKGLMGNAALYNKALSADEVKELFVSSGGTYAEDPTTEATTTLEAETTTEEITVAAEEDETTSANANEDAETTSVETTTADTTDTKDDNNNLMVILLIAGGVVVVGVVIAIVVNSSKKGKK